MDSLISTSRVCPHKMAREDARNRITNVVHFVGGYFLKEGGLAVKNSDRVSAIGDCENRQLIAL